MIDMEMLGEDTGRLILIVFPALYFIQVRWLYRVRFKFIHIVLSLVLSLIFSGLVLGVIFTALHVSTPEGGLLAAFLSLVFSIVLSNHLLFAARVRKKNGVPDLVENTESGNTAQRQAVPQTVAMGGFKHEYSRDRRGLVLFAAVLAAFGLLVIFYSSYRQHLTHASGQHLWIAQTSSRGEYTNEKYGFTMTFPKSCKLWESADPKSALIGWNLPDPHEPENDDSIRVSIRDLEPGVTLEDFYKMEVKSSWPSLKGMKEGSGTLAGKEDKWFMQQVPGAERNTTIWGYFLVDSARGFEIECVSRRRPGSAADEDCDKIIRSFQFTHHN